MDVLERDRVWQCIKCHRDYRHDVIFCKDCTAFRPLEMFKNMLYHPDNISQFERGFLDARREMEKTLIMNQDEEAARHRNEENQTFYIISQDWLMKWKNWITNRRSKDGKSSVCLPPGPICNTQLFYGKMNRQKVRPNLVLDTDYRAVSQEQWHLLLNIYGGGPIIPRQEKSIYSQAPSLPQRAGGGTCKSSNSGSSNSK